MLQITDAISLMGGNVNYKSQSSKILFLLKEFHSSILFVDLYYKKLSSIIIF